MRYMENEILHFGASKIYTPTFLARETKLYAAAWHLDSRRVVSTVVSPYLSRSDPSIRRKSAEFLD